MAPDGPPTGQQRTVGGSAQAGPGFAEPYSVLAVSDPAADVTSTQTWGVVEDTGPASSATVRSPAWPGSDPAWPGSDPAWPAGPGAGRAPTTWPEADTAAPPAAAGTGPASTAPADPGQTIRAGGGASAGAATGGHAERASGQVRGTGQAAPDTRTRQTAALPATRGRGTRGQRGRKRALQRGRRRPRALLVIGLVVVLAAGGGAAYLLLSGHHRQARPAAAGQHAAQTPQSSPDPAAKPSSSPSLGRWGHIATQATDPVPLTLGELFPARFALDGSRFARTAQRLSKHCGPAVFGSRLRSAVTRGSAGCTQALRASYLSGYLSGHQRLMGTIGVLNLKNFSAARRAVKVAGSAEFVAQLPGKNGPTRRLTKGTGLESAEAEGHYLILVWAENSDLRAPRTHAQRAELETFITRLIKGTVIGRSLSVRMVTGKPPS